MSGKRQIPLAWGRPRRPTLIGLNNGTGTARILRSELYERFASYVWGANLAWWQSAAPRIACCIRSGSARTHTKDTPRNVVL